jgi:short-subunit dehydrogenase
VCFKPEFDKRGQMKKLKGKNCLITGAASGIGRSLAFGLAKEGLNLFLADIDMEGLEKVRAEIEKSGTRVFTAKCDVSKYEDLQKLSDEFSSKMGDVDLLINNAGIAGAGLIEDLGLEDWKYVMEVNAWSIIYSIMVFLPRIMERGTGHIVNTSSGAGIVGIPYHAQYIASKFTVVGITEALYSEIKHVHKDINVSMICPTFLKTNIIDRTPITIPYKLLRDEDKKEVEARMDEFKAIFWEKYTEGAPSVDKAVKKYIKGIKKNKLYIFDMVQLRVAMILKGICEPLYKFVLRSEGTRHLKMIKESFAEMGIQTKSS